MDLLTHICSGAAAASVVAAFAGSKPARRIGMVSLGALGGALPDIDAVSLWSRFDATFGRWFSLPVTGPEIYGGKLWYSHHAFFHSLAAALLLAFVAGAVYYIVRRRVPWVACAAFVAGYLAHLAGDLPTPASVWGGIDLFWPSGTYVGGSGEVWWWNNYDIFLLAAGCALVNTVLLLAWPRRWVIGGVAVLALSLSIVQINSRQYDYAYKGNTAHYDRMERQSKEEQRQILGKRIYGAMERFDKRLPIHF